MRTPKKNPFIFDPKTDKVEFRMPTPVDVMARRAKKAFTGVDTQKGSRSTTQVVRLKKPYEGGDTLMEWHKEKTKSSISEAYRDADYATGLWRCENDWDRTKEYGKWIAMWVFLLYGLYALAVWANGVLP